MTPIETPQDFILEFRLPHKVFKQNRKVWVFIATFMCLGLAGFLYFSWQLWQVFANDPRISAKLATLDWHTVWAKISDTKKTTASLEIVLALLAIPVTFLIQHWRRQGKLIFDATHLHYQSGFPAWLEFIYKQNWSLSLDDLRRGKIAFSLVGSSWPSNPLLTYTLQWKSPSGFQNSLASKRLNVAAWFLPGENTRELPKLPAGLYWHSFRPWNTSEGQTVLQKLYEQLSLITALRDKGIPVPHTKQLKKIAAGEGLDMFAYPRMKAGILAFFGLLISSGFGYHFMRHQHFFEPIALWVWAAFGLAGAAVAWRWLAQEVDVQEKSLQATQVLIASLIGMGCALQAPSAFSAINVAFYPARIISVKVLRDPLILQAQDFEMPALKPDTAFEFWNSLASGVKRPLTLREGLFGIWQYDSEPLEQEVYQFYDKQPKPVRR